MTDAGGVAERAFFREEFRHTTIVIAVRDPVADAVAAVVEELLTEECRVLVVVAGDGGAVGQDLADRFGTPLRSMPTTRAELAGTWIELADSGLRIVAVDDDPAVSAAVVAGDLGVDKLVLTDPEGGCDRSFASIDDVAALEVHRPTLASAIRHALDHGVGGVNVCRASDLDTELFTFDGAGTLFTTDAYVLITPLGTADLDLVEQLVARGVAEGFLRPRERAEVVRLALDGLGARVGPSRHLAGLGAIEVEAYASSGVAEVACLYTVNRYVGEGIGGHLVDGLVEAARAGGATAIFACTVSDRAAALFERCGFHAVPQDRLPAEKWVGYDPARRARVAAHWLDLGTGPEPGAAVDTDDAASGARP